MAEVPDAVAPPPGNRRFPLLDGMRAVAVLCVLLVHVAVFSFVDFEFAREILFHLNIGVTIFFLISGFVLYRPFIAHRAGGHTRRRSASTRGAGCCGSCPPTGSSWPC